MSVLDLTSQPSSKETYSTLDYSEMFLGSVIGGQSEPSELSRCKHDFFVGDLAPKLFNVLLRLYQESDFVDYISVVDNFAGSIGSAKAKEYVDQVLNKVPAEFSPAKTIAILEKTYVQREATKILDLARKQIQMAPDQASEIMFQAQDKIDKLTNIKVDYKLSESIEATANEIITGQFDKFVIKTGLKGFDLKIGGLSTQEISVWAGRPGHGKTTTSVCMAKHILKTNPKIKIAKFELEMSERAMNTKLIASEAGVSSFGIRTNQLTDDDKQKIADAVVRLKEYDDRLFIFDQVYDLHTMIKICRALNIDLVMVDYIALMDGVEEDKRNELGKIAKYAKRDAKAHNRHWIFYSQLNRASELRENHAPQVSDLAESDQLGHIAAEIVLLYYQFKYTYDEKDRNMIRFLYDKSRYTGIAESKFYFNPDLTILRDV